MNESLNYIRQTIILIKYYSFDLNGYKIKELIIKWTKLYPHHWLPFAVTEAIYQGRLKAVSVEQILNVWQKKGQINQSFNYEFSRLIQPNIIISIDEDNELKYIFSNVNNQEKLPLVSNHQESHNLSENVVIDQEKTLESGMNNFEPLNDYSQCFQKLKGFISKEN
ncbi:hypothetical protein ACN4EE_18815 [Geminocystis sp. CENA526]|uniref:hypothetical protein n=1 Tax=Geminocystis sp. CENA526 TaxID=1355871 RepID=UPI003D6E4E90